MEELVESVNKQMEALGPIRDKLRKIISDAEELLECSDCAYESLEDAKHNLQEAADKLSELT